MREKPKACGFQCTDKEVVEISRSVGFFGSNSIGLISVLTFSPNALFKSSVYVVDNCITTELKCFCMIFCRLCFRFS